MPPLSFSSGMRAAWLVAVRDRLFVGKVLSQLSLSAWLPGVMLVANGAVLLQLRSQRNVNVAAAVVVLTQRPLGIVIVMIFALVVAAVVTQAFEFEVIRLLEGYWGASGFGLWLSDIRIRRHVRLEKRLRARRVEIEEKAFELAREKMKRPDSNVAPDIIEILTARVTRKRPVPDFDPDRVRQAVALGWRRYAPPDLLRRHDALGSRLAGYPPAHRTLPTRLGNTLRAAEDLIETDDVRTFIMRNYERIHPRLMEQHDEFRPRLNLYCEFVFVFVVLAILAPALLVWTDDMIGSAVAVSAGYLAFAWFSYEAAIASARGYGDVLRAVDASLRLPNVSASS